MPVVHPLIKQAQKNLPAKTPALEKEFIGEFYASSSGSDLDLMDVITLQRTAILHWDIMQKRKAGKCVVRVHNPATEKGGWPLNRTVIDFVDDDMPFQIDSMTAEVTRSGHAIHLMVHPLLYIGHNKAGAVTNISSESGSQRKAQSHIHIELVHMLPDEQCKELQDSIERVMNDVRYSTGDWQTIRGKLLDCENSLNHAPSTFPAEVVKECQAFLQYLYNDNFTLLGYREYSYATGKNGKVSAEAVGNSHLGLLRKEVKTRIMPEGVDALPPHLAKLSKNGTLMRVFKLDKKSTVHRSVPLDAIMVRLFDQKGKTKGEAIFIGLFTSVTYSRSIHDIPYLNRKTSQIMELSRFETGSHGYKALSHILEKYPRDELFQIDTDQLYDYAMSIVRLHERQRIALYTRIDAFSRHISCLVYVPRERYDTILRIKIQKILEEELSGVCDEFYMTLDDSPLARVMFIITMKAGKVQEFDRSSIESRLQEAGRAWNEQINEALYTKLTDDSEIANLTARYGSAFPSAYREEYEARQSVHDIFKIEKALASNNLERHLYRRSTDKENQLRLKLFRPGAPVVLSDILPILEKMGLRVIAELPFEIKPAGNQTSVWIHDFELEIPDAKGKEPIPVSSISENFEEALVKIWDGTIENDSLNRLILTTAMTWHDILILRSYVRYMRQGKTTFSIPYIEKALTDYPAIAKQITALFYARFNPALNRKKADLQADTILTDIEKLLNSVASLDQDRILRAVTSMVEGTLRTNFFQKDENGDQKSWLSFKMNSNVIPELPDPRPFREIWVYSPRMEGIHLRADRIARGGIRWSDRNEDFRMEVLGLMKAQQVKNAIIVPMGAKGGFILKCPPVEGGRAALQQEGIECYKCLVRGLLDITDNRKNKKIVPPQNVVRRDGDDPYLVVAADKGTATFSDIANGLSAEYDFWLGDAFASGGSVGYDHKKMGITARGAWESVKRHFRELGVDIQTTDFDVIGVGDMAGDVFGNGMLLSRHIRLVGAFNHVHIVCDPNPDIEASFVERERLFNEVKGWDQYNTKLLSKGGRIFLRSEKSISLTPEIMERFDIEQDKVTPQELMKAMLKAKTDLLWFGGIGTFIKATAETHADVGDKANDAVRIDASEIRARVMGEGANLGTTQRGRIEFSSLGGRLNADFIDNSGGVNSSDLEVNIKILMTDVVNNPANGMDTKKRNILLSKMTSEVAALVLRNSYQQAQGISLMTMEAPETLVTDAQFIRDLERDQSLKRKLENLPDETEIERRRLVGEGLVRPELCILQSYAKIHTTRELLDSNIPDQPEMQDFLITYFPKPLQDKYKQDILGHQLGREIIAMTIANGIVNRMGASFTKSRMDATGASCADVVRAFITVREVFGLRTLWDQIEGLDGMVPANIQLKALLDIRETTGRAVTWFLTRFGRELKLSSDIPTFTSEIGKLRSTLNTLIPPDMKDMVNLYKQDMLKAGFPESLAHSLAVLPILDSGFDIIRVSLDRKTDLTATARAYFEAGARFHIGWLRHEAENIPAADRWSQESRDNLINQLYSAQAGLAVRILRETKTKHDKSGAVALWLGSHHEETESIHALFETMRSSGALDIAKLMIAVERLRHLAEG